MPDGCARLLTLLVTRYSCARAVSYRFGLSPAASPRGREALGSFFRLSCYTYSECRLPLAACRFRAVVPRCGSRSLVCFCARSHSSGLQFKCILPGISSLPFRLPFDSVSVSLCFCVRAAVLPAVCSCKVGGVYVLSCLPRQKGLILSAFLKSLPAA